MSSFALLDEDYLLESVKQRKKKAPRKTKVEETRETIFTKIHLQEIWVVILDYFDIKILYLDYVLIDRKIRDILYSKQFQKSFLERNFNTIISTEEEKDHSLLLIKEGGPLQKRIEKLFELKDPQNIFGFQQKFISTETKPNQHLIFQKLYFALLNRRIKHANRNTILREQFMPHAFYYYAYQDAYCDYKRNTRKGTKAIESANPNGYGLMENEHRSDIEKEERKRLECDHFRFETVKDSVKEHTTLIKCKSCQAVQEVYPRMMDKLRKYL